jgi:hypothetical protein
MIILFEGARCTGKTTLSRRLVTDLKEYGFPAEWWKAERGEDPYEDMLGTIRSVFSDRSKLWVVDRFHLTEYVNSFASGRVLDKEKLWSNITVVDSLLGSQDTFIAFMMTSSGVREHRLKAEGREEPIVATYMNALWVDTIKKSRLPKIGIFNNLSREMNQAQHFLLTFAKAHWDRTHIIP